MALVEFVAMLLDRLGENIAAISGSWTLHASQWSDWWAALPPWSLPDWESHHYLTISFVIVVFWPIVVTLFMALTAASTWLFWLLTSLIFGVVQLIYVTYQFIMISADIFGLSMLKTFAVIRVQIRQYTMKSNRVTRRSRRREWRRLLDGAETYEDFIKIPIEPKVVEIKKKQSARSPSERSSWWGINRQNSSPEKPKAPSTPPRPQIRRSLSLGKLDISPSRASSLTRNKSFDGNEEFNEEQNKTKEIVEEELGMTGDILLTTSARLREAQMQTSGEGIEHDATSIKYLLSGVVKRNHLTLEDILSDNARSIAESGQCGLSNEALTSIHGFYEEVEKSLDWIAESPLEAETKTSSTSPPDAVPNMDSADPEWDAVQQRVSEISDRITLVRKLRQNVGRTALMLSGGGAQAMYHLGSIRALLESKVYHDIPVVSGTSGGSISAAMCAIKTPEELLRDVCVSHVSTDYMLDGKMKKQNIRWFPTNMEMAAYWLQNRLLVDSADFKRCCDFYYGDITFAEAFARTGKHVCITVLASRAQGVQRLLLNHISTPHVTLSSAVAASCALPGVMSPTKLLTKDGNGRQEPFEVDGVEWIDGSVQADLPFQRIATLFNVSNFVVSQTNFHIIPLLNKAHHPTKKSLYWRLFQTWEWDMRNRALKLSRLGLFPTIFGQDFGKIFKQKHHGNLTLVPRLTTMQTFGLKALANPTKQDMEGYLKYGQIAAWPYISVIKDMIRLERALDHSLRRLDERYMLLTPEHDLDLFDDVESIVSGSLHASSISNRVRFIGSGREAERLKHKVIKLEQENVALRRQLEDMQKKLSQKESGESVPSENSSLSRNSKADEVSGALCERKVSEKEVWSQVRRLRQEAVAI